MLQTVRIFERLTPCTHIKLPKFNTWLFYLVGVKTRANKRDGVSSNACKIGRAKAAVFPEPVSASPITSLPRNATGKASFCILVGHFQPSLLQASHNTSVTPCSNGVTVLCVWCCRTNQGLKRTLTTDIWAFCHVGELYLDIQLHALTAGMRYLLVSIISMTT